jgi:hypothetical protein
LTPNNVPDSFSKLHSLFLSDLSSAVEQTPFKGKVLSSNLRGRKVLKATLTTGGFFVPKNINKNKNKNNRFKSL